MNSRSNIVFVFTVTKCRIIFDVTRVIHVFKLLARLERMTSYNEIMLGNYKHQAASWRKRLGARLSLLGVPSSRLGHSTWVSCWTKRGLGRFFSGFLTFSPTTNFIPPFLHTHLIHFVSFHQPL